MSTFIYIYIEREREAWNSPKDFNSSTFSVTGSRQIT